MRVLLRVVRVYGTHDQYGTPPRTAPPEMPITLTDYPSTGELAAVYFGPAPDLVIEAYANRRAIGMLFLQALARSPECTDMSPMEIVEHFRADPELHFPINHWNWFTTLVIERSVDVDDSAIADRPHYWLQPAIVAALEADFESEARPHLDRLASAVAAVTRPGLLTDLVHSGVYFFAHDRAPFGDPKPSLSATASITSPMEQFPASEVQAALQQLARSPEATLRTLDSVRHWYLEARKEKDRWKRFLWSFLALEIMTRKLSKQFLAEVIGRFRLDTIEGIEPELLASLIPEHERLPLVAQFIVMSLALSPATTAADQLKFKAVKKARDRLSHGDLRSEEELPLAEAESLLQSYFRLAMTRTLVVEA